MNWDKLITAGLRNEQDALMFMAGLYEESNDEQADVTNGEKGNMRLFKFDKCISEK